MLIHNRQAYHAIEPIRTESSVEDIFRTFFGHCESLFEQEIGGDTEFKHGFHI